MRVFYLILYIYIPIWSDIAEISAYSAEMRVCVATGSTSVAAFSACVSAGSK